MIVSAKRKRLWLLSVWCLVIPAKGGNLPSAFGHSNYLRKRPANFEFNFSTSKRNLKGRN